MPEETKFDKELVRLLDRRPFVPFSIILNTGDRYEVVGPHQLAIGARDAAAVIHPKSGLSFFRKSSVVGVDAPKSVAE